MEGARCTIIGLTNSERNEEQLCYQHYDMFVYYGWKCLESTGAFTVFTLSEGAAASGDRHVFTPPKSKLLPILNKRATPTRSIPTHLIAANISTT